VTCGRSGKKKLAQLRDNSNYFRKRLIQMGYVAYVTVKWTSLYRLSLQLIMGSLCVVFCRFKVLGDYDSPVIPIMLFLPTKIPAFSRLCLEKDVRVRL